MGQKLTWDEIVEAYPDRWVALVDCDRVDAIVHSGIPIKACDDRERYKSEMELRSQGIKAFWIRTTDVEGPMGVSVLYSA